MPPYRPSLHLARKRHRHQGRCAEPRGDRQNGRRDCMAAFRLPMKSLIPLERASRMTLDGEFETVLAAAQAGAERAVAVLYRDINPRLVRYLGAKAPDVAED